MNLRITNLRTLPVALLTAAAALALTSCNLVTGAGDYMLFGMTGDAATNSKTCSSDITVGVTTIGGTQIALLEDGNQNSAGTVSSQSNNTDTATKWGYYQQEFCVYPSLAFTGTVAFPVSTNGTYSTRIQFEKSYPTTGSFTSTFPVTQMTFTGNGYSNRQCFIVQRVIDNATDPQESPLVISIGAPTTVDNTGVYAGKDPCDVSATVEDSDVAGVRVSSMSNVLIEPAGSGSHTGTFNVVLRKGPPAANVTIPINVLYDSQNQGPNYREINVDQPSLTFTTGNWNLKQTVTVTSQEDYEVDGTKQVTIQMQNTQSTDTNFNGIKPRDVVVVNQDSSSAGYQWTRFDSSTGNTTTSSAGTITGFATDEANVFGSNYAKFSIALRSKPSANVTLTLTNTGSAKSTVSPSTITITPSDWDAGNNRTTPQWIYVTGKTDGANSGNADYNVSFSISTTDSTYSGAAIPIFQIRSCDNDGSHLIQPCNFSGSSFGTSSSKLSVTEGGSTNSIWLISQSTPSSTTTVTTTSSGPSTDGTVPANVTLTSSNYNTMTGGGSNKIVLTAYNDTILNPTDPRPWTVATGYSTGGITYDPLDIYVQTYDNEKRFVISPSTGTTYEDPAGACQTISINIGATSSNSITLTPACSGGVCSEMKSITPSGGTIYAAGDTTTVNSWVICGADDTVADGNQNYTITWTASSSDSLFNGYTVSATITNIDNEGPAKAVFVTSGTYNGETTGVTGADSLCSSNKPAYAPSGTYKALIVSDASSGSRLVSSSWGIIKDGDYYYRCENGSCSDAASHLFVGNSGGGIPFPMSLNFSSNAGDVFWTGMDASMNPATQAGNDPYRPISPALYDGLDYIDNCAGWTYKNAPSNAGIFFYGQTWTANGTGNVTSASARCDSTYKLICVQQ